MNTKITANFENVDFASIALSNVRKSYTGLYDLRIKNIKRLHSNNKNNNNNTIATLSYYSQAPFDGVNYSPISVMPMGALPVSFLDRSIALNSKGKNTPVGVEIVADNTDSNDICNQIRSFGGYDVKIIN